MFVPAVLQTNPYRVLRLSASATPAEMHKAAANMRREALLGVATMTAIDIPAWGEVSRTDAEIRAAMGRLENPRQRLTDRLFWFHTSSSVVAHEFDEAAGKHDEALRVVFEAFDAGLDGTGISQWVRALRHWYRTVSNDNYWSLTSALEEHGAFEPAALPSEIDAVRADAVQLAAEPLVSAARDAFARNDTLAVQRVLLAFAELSDTGPWATRAQEDIVSPAVERFRKLCSAVREEFGSKVIREQDDVDHCWVGGQAGNGFEKVHVSKSERNKSLCDAALKRFREEIEPALKGIVQLVPDGNEAGQLCREQAALCLSAIATDYTWADDFTTSEKLHGEAHILAGDTLAALRIEDGLAQVRDSARKQRLFGKPISSAPSLRTINGFGFTLYGSSEEDRETGSCVTTYYFVALFLPLLPLARYRVINMGGGRYRFLGKLPLRKFDRWHLGIAAAIIAGILSYSIGSGQSNSSSHAASDPTGYASPADASASQPSELTELKNRIDSGRVRIQELKRQIQPVIDELNRLDARMKSLDDDLNSLKGQQDSGLQIDIDDYNAKVRVHNSLLTKRHALFATNESALQAYNDLIQQDSDLVQKYNALLK